MRQDAPPRGSKPPRIMITGMYRSGSTRLYYVLREALLKRHPDARCQHFGACDLFDEALAITGPGIIKEHTFSDRVVERVRSGDLQAVATIRDPVTTMVSLCATSGGRPNGRRRRPMKRFVTLNVSPSMLASTHTRRRPATVLGRSTA